MITRFGSSKEMILQEIEENGIVLQMLIDNRGLYLTEEKYLIRQVADTNRYSDRTLMEKRINALGIDYKELFETNKDRIQKMPTEKAAKVNPLKASKRSMKG